MKLKESFWIVYKIRTFFILICAIIILVGCTKKVLPEVVIESPITKAENSVKSADNALEKAETVLEKAKSDSEKAKSDLKKVESEFSDDNRKNLIKDTSTIETDNKTKISIVSFNNFTLMVSKGILAPSEKSFAIELIDRIVKYLTGKLVI